MWILSKVNCCCGTNLFRNLCFTLSCYCLIKIEHYTELSTSFYALAHWPMLGSKSFNVILDVRCWRPDVSLRLQSNILSRKNLTCTNWPFFKVRLFIRSFHSRFRSVRIHTRPENHCRYLTFFFFFLLNSSLFSLRLSCSAFCFALFYVHHFVFHSFSFDCIMCYQRNRKNINKPRTIRIGSKIFKQHSVERKKHTSESEKDGEKAYVETIKEEILQILCRNKNKWTQTNMDSHTHRCIDTHTHSPTS